MNFTIVIANTADSVQNFTISTVSLAEGVSVEVLNDSLAVTNMSVGESSGKLSVFFYGLICIF